MKKYFVLYPASIVIFGFLIISIYLPVSGSTSVVPPAFQPKKGNVKLDLNFGKFPLYFIANKGQVNKKAAFYAKASQYTLWLTKEGLVFDSIRKVEKEGKTERDVSRLLFLNANMNPEMVPISETKHRVNYFKGSDPAKWDCSIPTSRAVLYQSLYKNIDLKVYGIEKQIEYDWIVRPGGNPKTIKFKYQYISGTQIDEQGNLVITTGFGKISHKKPVSYQFINGKRIEIDVCFNSSLTV